MPKKTQGLLYRLWGQLPKPNQKALYNIYSQTIMSRTKSIRQRKGRNAPRLFSRTPFVDKPPSMISRKPTKKGSRRDGMAELIDMDAVELVRLIRRGEVSPLEVMEATLKRIDGVNPLINAFVSLRREEAIQEAKKMTESLA